MNLCYNLKKIDFIRERGERMKTIKGEELVGKELEVLEDGTLRLIKNKPKKHIPKLDEEYWYVHNFGIVIRELNSGCSSDDWIINHYPVFKTKKECEDYKEFLELLDDYKFEPDWNDYIQDKYYLFYDINEKRIVITCSNMIEITANPYFKQEELAQEFIEKAGKDNIKRYMFDVWE